MRRPARKNGFYRENGESDRRLKSLQKIMDLSLDVICTFDENGRFIEVSKACKDLFGYDPEELMGKQFIDLVVREDRARTEEAFNEVKTGKIALNFENRYIRKDEGTITVLWSARWDMHEKILYAVARDITEKKEIEEKIKQNEEKFRSAIERVSDAFIALDASWKYVYVNKRAGDILGRAPDSLIGRNIWEEFPESVGESFYIVIQKAMKEQKHLSLEEFYSPYQKWFNYHVYPSPDGLSVYFRDITERIEEEEKKRISETRLQKGQEIGALGYWEYDETSDVIWASEKVLEIFGFPADTSELKVEQLAACIHDYDNVKQSAIDLLFHNKKYDIEFLISPADGGTDKYISSIAEQEESAEGQTSKISGVIKDITERKLAEKKLLNAYHETNTILESITDGFLSVDYNWVVRYWNKAAEKIVGKSRKDVINKNLWEIYPDAVDTRFYRAYKKAKEENKSVHFKEYYAPQKAWFGLAIYPSDEGLSIFFQDITESMRQQKMNALEKETLELYSRKTFSLEKNIDFLLEGLPAIHPEMICSVTKVKDNKIFNWCSKQLPKGMNSIFDGLPIGMNHGTAAAAAFLEEKVEISEIAKHPFWKDFIEVANQNNIQASYSYPLFDSDHNLLGTFDIYYKDIHSIEKTEELSIERVIIILSDLIESSAKENALSNFKDQLELIYNTSTDIFFLLTVEGVDRYKFTTVNVSFLSATGLKRDQIEGKYIDDVIPMPSRKMVLEKYRQAIKEHKTISWEETTKYPSGRKTGIVSISPVFNENDECTKLVGVVHDITDSKRSEEKVRLSNEKLIRKNEELEVKNMKLQDIAWIQSHRVRAPLARIMGLINVLRLQGAEDMNTKNLYDYIISAADELDGLIREIVQKTEEVKQP